MEVTCGHCYQSPHTKKKLPYSTIRGSTIMRYTNSYYITLLHYSTNKYSCQ